VAAGATNTHTGVVNFSSENPHFCKSALARHSPWDFIAMVDRHNVPYHEKKLGQLFCDNKSELKTVLGEIFTKRMAALMTDRWFVSKPMRRYTSAELRSIAGRLSAWSVVPAGTEGYRTAEVTLGGVDTREISSKTMESRRSPGLYFIGEVLDVTGHLGGVNFQWAWASGHAADQHV